MVRIQLHHKLPSTPSAVTTQPGTRLVQASKIVAGGAGGGAGIGGAGGGGGAGGVGISSIPVCGNTALGAVTIGAGGSAWPNWLLVKVALLIIQV